MPTNPQPRAFHLHPTPHVPNSRLPALVYRTAFPASPADGLLPEIVCNVIESNHWLKGGIFHHYPTCHFHSVTHEVYVVLKGWSKIRLGQGPLDKDIDNSLVLNITAGDVLVVPVSDFKGGLLEVSGTC